MTSHTGTRFEDRLLAAILARHPATAAHATGADLRDRAAPRALPILPPRPARRIAAAGAAAVSMVAAGLSIGFTAGRSATPAPRPNSVLDAKTVAFRVTQAVAQASRNSVDNERLVWTNRKGQVVSVTVIWMAGNARRIERFAGPSRSPDRDESFVFSNSGVPETTAGRSVDYGHRVWFRQISFSGFAFGAPPDAAPPGGFQMMLRHGWSRVAGRPVVDGRQTIQFVAAGHFPVLGQVAPGPVTERLWVDPATYLPVKWAIVTPQGVSTRDYRWLAPTAANRAELTAPIPPGFTFLPQPPPYDR